MEELAPLLAEILDSGWVTNQGEKAQALEKALANFLQVPEVLLVTNATLGLSLALRSLLPEGGR
jgi:dTDP-4-amino-4,6-dideoxygalactose transaminase